MIVFYDKNYDPIDFTTILCSDEIPGGVAKRIEGSVGYSVKELSTDKEGRDGSFQLYKDAPRKLEIRILDFQLTE